VRFDVLLFLPTLFHCTLRTMKTIIFFLTTITISISLNAQKQPGYASVQPIASPQIFAEGIISVGNYESHPSFSPTGDTVYFVKSNPDISKWTIWVSYFRGNKWSSPQVAPFSGQYWDADPFFSPDGKELYFISNRPAKSGGEAKDFDIWKMQRTKTGWGPPVQLPVVINSPANEYYPTIASNGTLYFGSRRDGGKGNSDIYKSELRSGKYQEPENLGDGINSAGSEFEPFISPDETFIIFMAARPDHLDNADLYIAHNKNGQWGLAKKLPAPFNSEVTEFSPSITRDGKYFFFASARNKNSNATSKPETTEAINKRLASAGNGLGDIYQVDMEALQIEK
jgi:Tol biopolymer transport system component